MRQRLYDTSIRLMGERGYEAATLREVARRSSVSLGLMYRYFPSKRAVVMKLYDDLSAEFVTRSGDMPEGRWTKRFMFALTTSLDVLAPHRGVLSALVADPNEGVFAPATVFSRLRVLEAFVGAVRGATDAPRGELVGALGRLLYLVHLAVILWWLLDRSPDQRATRGWVALIGRLLPRVAPALRLGPIRNAVLAGDVLIRDGLLS